MTLFDITGTIALAVSMSSQDNLHPNLVISVIADERFQ